MAQDKEKARQCWEQAAAYGDVAAIYKLGDMHQNGDTERNSDAAWTFYRAAYRLSNSAKDSETYPDVCLRYLRYGEGRLSRRELAHLAGETVTGFQKRLEEGDPFAEKALEEAKDFCRKYCET